MCSTPDICRCAELDSTDIVWVEPPAFAHAEYIQELVDTKDSLTVADILEGEDTRNWPF